MRLFYAAHTRSNLIERIWSDRSDWIVYVLILAGWQVGWQVGWRPSGVWFADLQIRSVRPDCTVSVLIVRSGVSCALDTTERG